MRKSLKLFINTLLVIALATTSVFAAAPETETASAGSPSASSKGVININTADAAQLAFLPRIGIKAGERIVVYRKENGPFKKTTDLMQVKGIGDKTFELLSPYLAVDGKTTLTSKQSGPRKPRASKKAKASQAASNTAQ